MKIFTCKTFAGYWPVGSAAVVQAMDNVQAAEILNAELKKISLPGDATPQEMIEFPDTDGPEVRILCDGDY